MKKTVLKLASLILVASMLIICASCTSQVVVRFVDKDGNDLFADGSSAGTQQTTAAPSEGTPATAAPATSAPVTPGEQTTAAPAEATQAPATQAPDGSTPETQAPASEAPATQAPASEAPATQAPASEAPASEAPASEAPASSLSSSSSKEEIVAKYIEVYNATKATGTFVGHDSMECTSVTLDGKENSALKSVAGGLMKTDTSISHQLPPFTGDNDGKICATNPADIETATYVDNGDGTATIKLVPKPVTNSRRFADAQGNMFNVMEDVASALSGISVISWSEGDANSNVTLTSEGGYCEVTFNTSTNIMTKANYVLGTTAAVTHANVLLFKDKSATAKFVYTMSYPA